MWNKLGGNIDSDPLEAAEELAKDYGCLQCKGL